MTAHSPIILDTADERGVPTRAHCECGWTWVAIRKIVQPFKSPVGPGDGEALVNEAAAS